MSTKTITIMDDAYELLARNKRNNESFSEVIRRTLSKKRDIMKFAGILKDVPPSKIEDIKDTIRKLRENSTKELFEKINR